MLLLVIDQHTLSPDSLPHVHDSYSCLLFDDDERERAKEGFSGTCFPDLQTFISTHSRIGFLSFDSCFYTLHRLSVFLDLQLLFTKTSYLT